MLRSTPPALLTIVALVGLIVATSCTKREEVFVERVLFEQPPAAAQGFLGYDEANRKLTTCGNCHVGQQARWQSSGHSQAWQTLAASGHVQASCYNCHTVGPNGNPTDGAVGWAGANDPRYQDVQCESCHGPGLEHVTNPDASQPHARITVATNTGSGIAYEGCAECHQGAHHPFVEEWALSGHAFPLSSPSTRAECIGCHTGQGALAAFAPDAEYVEKNAPLGQHVGIVCSVCHDPHGSSNHGQLRHPIDVPDPQRNLCMRCHQRRSEPEMAGTLRGPHSPEGPLLLGEAGWWPPGFEPQVDRIRGTHGTDRNPKLCATCHVSSYTVTDSLTGAFQLQVTGHRFEAIPCVTSTGSPTGVDTCSVNSRSFRSCTTVGCHGDEDAARTAYLTSKTRIENLVATVDQLLTQVPPGERDSSDGRFTVADGAWFNAELGRLKGTSTHNPFLSEQLLVASIQALRDAYNLPVPSNISLELSLR